MSEIKFELSRLTDYSDEAIIREIQRVAKLISTPWITGREFNKHSKASRNTIQKRFGSWKNALEQAGLSNRYSTGDIKGRGDSRKYTNRRYTDEEIITELRRVSALLNNRFVTQVLFEQHSQMHAENIAKRFGSWSKALKHAGLEISNLGKRYTESEYWENLLSVWTHYGRQPTFGEMSRPPSKIKAEAYKSRWGTWTKALLAFVEYANSTSKVSPITHKNNSAKNNKNTSSKSSSFKEIRISNKISPEDRREIPLGLRFKVMYRDHFKCVLCGDNPPVSPGLVLHVDHIVPWSKGGKTQIDNLRTLCANCNIGRGNRYTD